MTREEFYDKNDFGFSVKENFEQYITRVGNSMLEYKKLFGEPSQALKNKIIEIFECAIVPNKNNPKFHDVTNLLRKNLNKEPTVNDLSRLIIRLRSELDKPLYIKTIDSYSDDSDSKGKMIVYNVETDSNPIEGTNVVIIKKYEQKESK